jgi:hypothetical protein
MDLFLTAFSRNADFKANIDSNHSGAIPGASLPENVL